MMYRIRVKNKSTGQEKLVWESYDKSKKEFCYYSDIECNNILDKKEYEEIEDDASGIPFDMFGIECGNGWIPLIKPIIEYIDKYNETASEKIHITQIKEKYGTLRFYVSYGTKELYDMIDKAEEDSENVCEFCGSRKNIGMTQGYYMTICHDCLKEDLISNGYSKMWHSYDDNNVYWVHPDKEDELISDINKFEEDMP